MDHLKEFNPIKNPPRLAPLRPVRRVNKNAIRFVCVGVAAVLFMVVAYGLMNEKKKKPQQNLMALSEQARTGGPAFLDTLPADYSEVSSPAEEEKEKPVQVLEEKAPEARPLPRKSNYRHENIKSNHRSEPAHRVAIDSFEDQQLEQENREARRSGIFFDGESRAAASSSHVNSFATEEETENTNPAGEDLLGRSSNKHGFLTGGKGNVGRLTPSRSAFAVTQGTVIPAVLLSKINSDLPGPILGRVSENIFDSKTGKNLIIPQGSKLIGEYNSNVSFGQSRAQVVWTRVIFPNTESVDLGRMPGTDKQGTSGHKGQVDQHWDQVAAGIVFSTLLSAGVAMAQPPNGAAGQAISPQQQLSQSLAQNVNQVGAKIADRSLGIQPTITVESGTRISVFVMKDLELKAYSK